MRPQPACVHFVEVAVAHDRSVFKNTVQEGGVFLHLNKTPQWETVRILTINQLTSDKLLFEESISKQNFSYT